VPGRLVEGNQGSEAHLIRWTRAAVGLGGRRALQGEPDGRRHDHGHRRPRRGAAGVVTHTDRGSPGRYTAGVFSGLCTRNRITQSMSPAGFVPGKRPRAETRFSWLKNELVCPGVLPTGTSARRQISQLVQPLQPHPLSQPVRDAGADHVEKLTAAA